MRKRFCAAAGPGIAVDVRIATTLGFVAVVALLAGPSPAQEPTDADADTNSGAEKPQVGDASQAAASLSQVEPDPPDLRAGHWLLSVSGGVWVPTTELVPALPGLGELGVGPTGHLQLGVGLSRHLVLRLEGGAAYATGDGDNSAISIDAGGALVYHLSQGFALDPWVGYGLGYRHTLLALSDDDRSVSAFDVARLSIGADFFPAASFGFGPYFEADIGIRGSVSYGAVHTGLRISFDPMRAGTNLSPTAASFSGVGFGGF